jgi:hypothetical protein
VRPARGKLEEKSRDNDESAKLIATLMEIPFLKSLYLCSQERGFIKMRYTEGSFVLETGEGQMSLKNIDLVSPVGRLKGEVRCESTLVENLKPKAGESGSALNYVFSGDLLLGLPPEIGRNIPEIVRKEFILPGTPEGLEWIKISFKNDKLGYITSSAATEMDRLMRLSWAQPTTPAK